MRALPPPTQRTVADTARLDAHLHRGSIDDGRDRAILRHLLRSPPQRAAAAVALDDDDSDLEILDAPPEAAKGPEQVLHDDVDGDGDLVVVGSSGLVASNMPHPRHACTTHRFRESKARRTVAENARRCDHCWCFVCEVRAAECPQWSSNDVQKPAHCNAYPKAGFWADEKAARGFGAGAARAVTL